MSEQIEYRLGQIEARLDIVSQQQRDMHADIRSLLETRAYQRGAMRVIAVLSAVISAVVSFFVGLAR